MDISFYISELLEQHGEISIPGLGYLVQAHISGYYNDAEGKFYPPHRRVEYDPQQLDDDTLVERIAIDKNISLASAKYFTEKYVNTIKEDALEKDVAIANLGWFYTEHGKLVFKSANLIANDPAFFGYPPVNITKIAHELTPVIEPGIQDHTHAAETANTAGLQPVNELSGTEAPVTEEVYEEVEPQRSYGWLILLVVILVAALSVFGMYKLYPAQYQSAMAWAQNITGAKTTANPKVEEKKPAIKAVIPPTIDTMTADSGKQIKSTEVPADQTAPANAKAKQAVTTPAATNPVTTTVTPTGQSSHVYDPQKTWAVIVMSCHTQAVADEAINNYKAKGIDAFTVSIAHSSSINIAVGIYHTNPEADAAREKFAAAKQIPHDAYITLIKPPK